MFWLRGEECEKLNLFGCVNLTPPQPIILHGIHQNWTHCSICKTHRTFRYFSHWKCCFVCLLCFHHEKVWKKNIFHCPVRFANWTMYLSILVWIPVFSSFCTFTDWINANSLELNEKLFFEKITASTYMRWKKVHQNSIKAFGRILAKDIKSVISKKWIFFAKRFFRAWKMIIQKDFFEKKIFSPFFLTFKIHYIGTW